MKNIRPVQIEFNKNFPKNIGYVCHDNFKDRLFIFSEPNILVYSKQSTQPININISCYFDKIPKIVTLTYNPNKSQFWAVFATGEIFAFNENFEAEIDCHEEIFSLEHCTNVAEGILSMKWNSTMDKFVILSADYQLIFLDQSCELLNTVDIHSNEETENKWISIGWGKKETQFHGSVGKQAALVKEKIPEDPFIDIVSPAICWAEKGNLLAINIPSFANKSRHIRIYNSTGVLQCISADHYGLYRFLTYNTLDSLFISAEKLNDQNNIVFYEKNGLIHSKLPIGGQAKDSLIKTIKWNSHLEILIIWLWEESHDSIQVYSTTNHFWYLKQNYHYDTENSRLVDFSFNKRTPYKLHVITKSQEISYTLANIMDHSLGTTLDDLGSVAVINGCKLHLTSFREKIISPPLSEHTLELNNPISLIAYAPECYSSNDLIILNNLNEFYLASYGNNNYDLILQKQIKLNNNEIIYHLIWIKDYILFSTNTDNNYKLYKMNDKTYDIECIENLHFVFVTHVNSQALYMTASRKYILYNNTDFQQLALQPPKHFCDLSYCSKTGDYFNLDELNDFYINGEKVANHITSYYLHSNFLIVTTSAHRLIITKLKGNLIERFKKNMDQGRRIENNGKIIIALAGSSEIILQFPRGNLEVLNPRHMTYHLVNTYVDNKEYRKAVQLCRKFKLNMDSIIYKGNLDSLLNNIPYFINDVDNPRWIALFITDLKKNEKIINQLPAIFNALEKAMKDISINKYIEPLLTLKVEENNIPEALELINCLIQNPPNNPCYLDSVKALYYLKNLVQTTDLFKEALGIYDLNLACFIAQHTNQDPQEYIPFLNNLQSMNENFRNYTINNHLNKPLKALIFLVKCPGMENECLDIINKNLLYKEALNILNPENTLHSITAHNYAEYLSKQGHPLEAALLLVKLNNSELAAQYFANAGEWKQALYHCDLSRMERNLFIKTHILPVLLIQNRFSEASLVLSDIEEKISLLCTHRLWSEALINAQTSQRFDLIETHIIPGICQHAATLLEHVKATKTQLTSYVDRLTFLRGKKKLNQNSYQQGTPTPYNNEIDDDMYSDVSTLSTATRTSRTSRSSKNKRKLNRKFLSLKASNPYEDLALVVYLHDLYKSLYKLSDEVRSLGLNLLYFSKEKEIFELQDELEDLFRLMHQYKLIIWDPTIFPLKYDIPEGEEREEPELELKFQVMPEEPSSSWKFLKF